MVIHSCGKNTGKKRYGLIFLSWNVCTLLDNSNQDGRRTGILGQRLRDYRVNIAALSETRLLEVSSLEEVGAGYNFFWSGRQESAPLISEVGFAIRTSLACKLGSFPIGISDRLMVLRLRLRNQTFATIISVYTPTMTHTDEVKNSFYEDLERIISATSWKDKLILL